MMDTRVHKVILDCLLLVALLAAVAGCGGTATPSPAPQTATVLPVATTPPLPPTATETSTLVSPTPTTQPSSVFVQPVAEAAIIELDSWSLTSDWLAYWLATARDRLGKPYPSSPATLNFFNARTLEACSAPRFVARDFPDYYGRLVWQPDGSVVVFSEGTPFQGMPCKNDFVAMPDPSVMPKSQDPALSPGGTYRVQTMIRDRTNWDANVSTTILSTSDGQVANTVNWSIHEREGGIGRGGEWVTDSLFLIHETADQGPLLIHAGKNVVQVAPELFRIPFRPSIPVVPPNTEVMLYALASALPNTDTYHLILFHIGSESAEDPYPPILLYHSETGAVEQMPFKYHWSPAFSPDGRWLLMDKRPIRGGYESESLWIRSVDPVNAEIRYIGEGTSRWTADWTKVAFVLKSSVSVLTFPGGEPLGTWNVSPLYSLSQGAWSPSGQFVALTSTTGQGQGPKALFIIDVER